MKLEWLVSNLTAVGFSARAESDFFEVILGVFWPIQAAFVVGQPLCDLQIPSWALKPYFGSFDRNKVVKQEKGVIFFW